MTPLSRESFEMHRFLISRSPVRRQRPHLSLSRAHYVAGALIFVGLGVGLILWQGYRQFGAASLDRPARPAAMTDGNPAESRWDRFDLTRTVVPAVQK